MIFFLLALRDNEYSHIKQSGIANMGGYLHFHNL